MASANTSLVAKVTTPAMLAPDDAVKGDPTTHDIVSPVAPDKKRVSNEGLANTPIVPGDTLQAEYQEVNYRLYTLAGSAKKSHDEIVADLAKMKAILSQRGGLSNRAQRKQYGYSLISWSAWACNYAEELDKSFRQIQRWIRDYESPTSAKKTKKDKPVRLTPAQQKALVQAQLAANNMVSAYESGGDVRSALKEYKRVAVNPSKLDDYFSALDTTAPAAPEVVDQEETEPPLPAKEQEVTAEEVYRLLAPTLYSLISAYVKINWDMAVIHKEKTGEEIPENIRVPYYENFIVTNRKYVRYPEILKVPWPTLKVATLPITTRLGRGVGPPVWLCITEPNGDVIECSIDGAGEGKCTTVRRIKAKPDEPQDNDSQEVSEAHG